MNGLCTPWKTLSLASGLHNFSGVTVSAETRVRQLWPLQRIINRSLYIQGLTRPLCTGLHWLSLYFVIVLA